MIEYFRPEIDRENALDHSERDLYTAVAPSKLYEILQTEYNPALSVLCFADGSIEVVVESIDESLSSCGTRGVQPFPEP